MSYDVLVKAPAYGRERKEEKHKYKCSMITTLLYGNIIDAGKEIRSPI